MRTGFLVRTSAAVVSVVVASAHAGGFATSVAGYNPGANAASAYNNALAALGGPERVTGELAGFTGDVTPFNPAFGTDEVVSIGSGGSLTLGFAGGIADDASHAFGIDLIIFGNAGFIDSSWSDADPTNDGSGLVGGTPTLFGVGGQATVQVSANGDEWFTAAITAIDLFPTLAFAGDGTLTDPFRAMDPSLGLADIAGMTAAELSAFYGSSAGGVGIDISGTGLTSASYVRLLNESGHAFEIDAVVAVPAPSGTLAIGAIGILAARRRRR